MKKARFRRSPAPGFRRGPAFAALCASACAAVLLLAGCRDPLRPLDEAVFPSMPLSESGMFDAYAGGPADAVVDLFQPVLDTALGSGAQSALEVFPSLKVFEEGGNRVVEYRASRRRFGSWSDRREFEANLFLLRSLFLAPGAFEDTAGLATTADLYARAAEHDLFTRYVEPARAADYERQSSSTEEPRVVGIQVRANDAGDSLFLYLVAPGSPADRAGLRRGMAVLAVNGTAVTGDSARARFVRLYDADSVGTVRLTVRAPGGAAFSRDLARESVRFPSVLADTLGGVGYIAIQSFTSSTVNGGSTATEFIRALRATRGASATLLDLRGNAGGSLAIALRVCEEMIGSGVLFRVLERRYQNGGSVRYLTTWRAGGGQSGEGRRYVVLADSTSASAAELIVAALRDRLDAPFIGTRTYGKGVGQVAQRTGGGGYALVTYGSVTTASGLDYNGTGLEPTHPRSAKPDALLAEALALAAAPSAALSKRAARALEEGAGLLEWNRRQGARNRVEELDLRGK